MVNIDDTIGLTEHRMNCLIDSTNRNISNKYLLLKKVRFEENYDLRTSFPMKLNSPWLKLAEHVEYRGRSDRKWQQAERCGPATDLIKIAA